MIDKRRKMDIMQSKTSQTVLADGKAQQDSCILVSLCRSNLPRFVDCQAETEIHQDTGVFVSRRKNNPMTKFQERIIEYLKKCPNKMSSTWGIAQNEFPEKWTKGRTRNARSGRGALVGHIVRASSKLDCIVILPPKTQYDDYTICYWEPGE